MLILNKYRTYVVACNHIAFVKDTAVTFTTLSRPASIVNVGVPRKKLDELVVPALVSQAMLARIYNYDLDVCLSKRETYKAFSNDLIPHPEVLVDVEHYPDPVLIRQDGLSRRRGMQYAENGAKAMEILQAASSSSLFCVQYIPDVTREVRVLVWERDIVGAFDRPQTFFIPQPFVEASHLYDRLATEHCIAPGLPDAVFDYAIRAVRMVNLDWGAVDIGIRSNGDAVVFEVNSAPGIWLHRKADQALIERIRSVLQ